MSPIKVIFLLSTMCFTLFITNSCTTDSAEILYASQDDAALELYNKSLKSVIDSKCLSCHSYHLEGINRYDSFEKTKSAISKITERINSKTNAIMPPASESVLSEAEKASFQNFVDLLNGSAPAAETMQSNFESNASAFRITWTAYKFADYDSRAGVSGTFDKVSINLNTSAKNSIDQLDQATVLIQTKSVNIDGEMGTKTNSIRNHFFAYMLPDISAKVVKYDSEKAIIQITMNGISQMYRFTISEQENKILLRGKIDDVGAFNWSKAYEMLDKVCGKLHENKVWPDVDLEIHIPKI